jgi:hypothetical protein
VSSSASRPAARFLFAAVRIGESTAPNGRFDYGRIENEQNRL